jgi:allantoate deiminase
MSATAQALDVAALGRRAEEMLIELSKISADSKRIVRLFLTPEHRRSADLVAEWMRDAGLSVSEDALGTVKGRYGDGRRLLIGSHIDTVVDAGMYDGTFGVVAGVIAAGHFAKTGRKLPFGIDVLAFGDEEGSRFSPTLSSSLACAGAFGPANLAVKDSEGLTLGQALTAYGKKPDDYAAAAYRPQDVAAYVEAHIEQGPVLESRNQPLGVVSAIIGQTYLLVEIFGEAGHAGTVPMMLRRDAMSGGAEAMLLAEKLARETKGEVVATVGRINVTPGAANVIPGHVALMADVRSGNDAARARFVEQFKAGGREIADRRNLGISIKPTREVPTTPCNAGLQELIGAAISDVGAEPQKLGSGAGHDGQAMSKLCPIGMLFVRCRGGISHNPMEYASPRDMGLAVAALIRFIERFEPGKIT